MQEAIRLMREAAQRLRGQGEQALLIPEEDEGERYPMGIKAGPYQAAEVAEAVQFLADMLEA